MATARAKVQKAYPQARAQLRSGVWEIVVRIPNEPDGAPHLLGASAHRESWAWADAWRMMSR
jgi:hypothetical protein